MGRQIYKLWRALQRFGFTPAFLAMAFAPFFSASRHSVRFADDPLRLEHVDARPPLQSRREALLRVGDSRRRASDLLELTGAPGGRVSALRFRTETDICICRCP